MPNVPVLSFNSGVLSPQIDARSDVDKYRSGCRILENMIPRIYGTATRRPGTKFIAEQTNHDNVGRVIPFIYSNTIAYIILLENRQMRFFYDGGIVLGTDGRELILSTPYLAADLFQLQYKQSNDVMWIVHPDYAPRKLTRTSANAFSLDTITFVDGPFKKRNDLDAADSVTMTPSAVTGTGITLTASAATFDSTHVGALFKLTQARAVTETSGSKTAPNTGVVGSAVLVEGAFTFNTHGTWTGTVKVERSIDAGSNWETYRTWVGADDRNVQYTGTEDEDNIQYRINVTALSSGTIHAELTINSSTQEGICRVTAYTSNLAVTVTVLKDFGQTSATTRWAEGCWSPYRGYPVSVTFFEERCIYAGTAHQPQTIWLSATDDYEDFEACTKDDSSFSLTMSSDTRNAIRWISALEALLIGTTGGEWRLRSTGQDEPLTPTNYSMKQQTTYGNAAIQALPVNDVILFVDFVARKIRELTYSGDELKFIAPDLTALAEHITDSGITSMAYQKNPDPILWMTLTDGTLLSMTYEREQNVVAFAKHLISKGSATESDDTKYAPGTAYPTLRVADATHVATPLNMGDLHDIPISSVDDLQNMRGDLKGHYYLTQDIDASATSTWNSGQGFEPVGTIGTNTEFAGTFDGCGYKITNLYMAWPTSMLIGLFGDVFPHNGSDVVIANLTLEDCNIGGARYVGPLAGYAHCGKAAVEENVTIQNCHVTGTSYVVGLGSNCSYVGGLLGATDDGTTSVLKVVDCTTNATVNVATQHTDTNPHEVGGFVGDAEGSGVATNRYINCRATGDVTLQGVGGNQANIAGGFVGYCQDVGLFMDCAATGDVGCDRTAGGFCGDATAGRTDAVMTFVRCSARGDVTITDAGDGAGGFVGIAEANFTDCYSWGDVVTATNGYAGGFAYCLYGGCTITNTYAVGAVSGPTTASHISGYVQYLDSYDGDDPVIVASYWDTTTTGQTSGVGYNPDGVSDAPIGHITSWMQHKPNFEDADWDLHTVWTMPAAVLWDSTTYDLGANSIAVIPSISEDEVWLTVSRVINGEVKRYLEQMQPRDFGDQEDAFFMDSGLSYDDVPADEFSGLDHLEGETVIILGDGAAFGSQVVSGGAVTISNEVSKAAIGLDSTYKLKPMRFDLTTQKGTTKGSIKRIPEIVVSFFETLNAQYGRDEDHLFTIDWRKEEAYDSPPALYTGDKELSHEGGYDPEDSVLIMGSGPFPCTVRAIIPRLEVTGR